MTRKEKIHFAAIAMETLIATEKVLEAAEKAVKEATRVAAAAVREARKSKKKYIGNK